MKNRFFYHLANLRKITSVVVIVFGFLTLSLVAAKPASSQAAHTCAQVTYVQGQDMTGSYPDEASCLANWSPCRPGANQCASGQCAKDPADNTYACIPTTTGFCDVGGNKIPDTACIPGKAYRCIDGSASPDDRCANGCQSDGLIIPSGSCIPGRAAVCVNGTGVADAACGGSCTFGGQAVPNGACLPGGKAYKCVDGSAVADSKCPFDYNSDPNNCGGAGNQCGAGNMCAAGKCFNPNTDPFNCGMVGNVCGNGLVCAAGKCSNLNTDPKNCGLVNHVCTAGQVCSSGKCVAGTGGTGPGPSASPGGACTVSTDCVAGQFCLNGTCTDTTGGTCNNGVCTGGACTAIHTCDQLDSNGWCVNQTPEVQPGDSNINAQDLANQKCKCVQVDVLNGGSGSCTNGHINGDWSTLIGSAIACPDANAHCGGNPPGSPPPSTPPGSNPPGPVCMNISKSVENPKVGDSVTFTCGQVSGADHYVFRVENPDGNRATLKATGRVSEPMNINKAGKYTAQCQICTGNSDSTCHAFEHIPQ